MDDRSSDSSFSLALAAGAAAAMFVLLPHGLKVAALHGALVGAALGALLALGRRLTDETKKKWHRYLMPIPLFAVGASIGFVLVMWLAPIARALVDRIGG